MSATISASSRDAKRRIGFLGSVSIGVAAIVGGGILVLGGLAIGLTGPGNPHAPL